jgi:hypothetical protein
MSWKKLRVYKKPDTAKSTIDSILETIKHTMEETIERVKYTSTVIEQVDQNPWIMLGSAVLTGYVLRSERRKIERGKSPKQHYISDKVGNMMETIEKSIDINGPVRTAYNQWTQFEEFPASWKAWSRSSSLMIRHSSGWRTLVVSVKNGEPSYRTSPR